jgi:cytochrome c
VEFDLDTESFQNAFDESKYAPIEGFSDKRSGHIVLQDHGDAVWYRNIKIKVLD